MDDDSLDKAYLPNSAIPNRLSVEWRLLPFVCFEQMKMDFLWAIFFAPFLFLTLPALFPKLGEQWLSICMIYLYALLKGVFWGILTAKWASSRKYLHAALFGLVASITPMVWSFFAAIIMAIAGAGWAGYEELWNRLQWLQVGGWVLVIVLGALYSVYMAQSLKRTRGAQID